MRSVSLCVAVGLLAAVTSTPTQCDNQLTPAQEAVLKKACTTYKTQPGDTPYSLAERFYGKGYMSYRIQEANKQYLTKEGFFKPNTLILIPPDDRGRSVDTSYPYERTY